jgi:DNA replication protein DnaC
MYMVTFYCEEKFKSALRKLSGGTKLRNQNPDKRPTIAEAMEIIKGIGDDSYKESAIFTHYIRAIREKIANDPSSLSLNQNIVESRQDFIPLKTTTIDPFKFSNLATRPLFEQIDQFFQSEHTSFLLLGAAGCGKSVALQLKFIEAIDEWKLGNPLPIYFNLANTTTTPTLKNILQELDRSIETNIVPHLATVHLYVDSYDEGVTT